VLELTRRHFYSPHARPLLPLLPATSFVSVVRPYVSVRVRTCPYVSERVRTCPLPCPYDVRSMSGVCPVTVRLLSGYCPVTVRFIARRCPDGPDTKQPTPSVPRYMYMYSCTIVPRAIIVLFDNQGQTTPNKSKYFEIKQYPDSFLPFID